MAALIFGELSDKSLSYTKTFKIVQVVEPVEIVKELTGELVKWSGADFRGVLQNSTSGLATIA